MTTVGQDLDIIQRTLNDSGAIWARAELLRWYRDAFVQFLSQSSGVRRWTILDVPGRTAYAMTQEWEDRFTNGTNRALGLPAIAANMRVTAMWEAERLSGTTTTNAREMVTHLWEMLHSGEVDDHFRFHLPKANERIITVTYDDRSVFATGVTELDDQDREWMRKAGRAFFWTLGLGRIRTFEVYEVELTDGQAYVLGDSGLGIARLLSGSRTYATTPQSFHPITWSYTTDGERLAMSVGASRFDPTFVATSHGDRLASESLGTVAIIKGGFASRIHGTQGWEADSVTADGTIRHLWPWQAQYANALGTPTGPVERVGLNVPRGTGALAAVEVEDDLHAGVSAMHILFGWEAEHVSSDTSLLTRLTAAHPSPVGTASFEAWYADRVGGTFAAFTRVGDYPVGIIRSIDSPDRQYLPRVQGNIAPTFLGIIRQWASTPNNIGVVEAIAPRIDFDECDTPPLIPRQMQKHLRWYVLFKAFGQTGEGRRVDDASHYRQLYARGVQAFRNMTDVTRSDRIYQRETADEVVVSRPARPRLPSEYPLIER